MENQREMAELTREKAGKAQENTNLVFHTLFKDLIFVSNVHLH